MSVDDRLQYAEWALTEKNDPKPLRDLHEQLRATRIGKQLARVEELMAEYDTVGPREGKQA